MKKYIFIHLLLLVVVPYYSLTGQNVGISDQNFIPQSTLHIFRNVDANILQLSKSSLPNTGLIFSVNGNSWTMRNWQDGELQFRTGNSFMSFYTNNLERLRILADGRVGIGITVPSHQLTVAGSNSTVRLVGTGYFGVGATMVFGETTPNVYLSEFEDDKLRIHSNNHINITGTTAMTPGLLGVGTGVFQPRSLLHVMVNANTNFLQLSKSDSDNSGLIVSTNGNDWFVRNHESGALIFQTGTNTTAGNIRFITNNIERLRIASDGKVGIGTVNPMATLHVVGSVRFQNLDPAVNEHTALFIDAQGNVKARTLDPVLFNGFTEVDTLAWLRSGNVASMNDFIGTLNAVDFRIFTNGLERVRVSSSGNVGIGTTTPAHRLDVSFNGSDRVARIRNNSNMSGSHGMLVSTLRSSADTYILNLEAGGTSRMYVRSDGNVGIGTDAPQQRFHLVGTARISTLAQPGGAIVISDVNGDLSALSFTGNSGQVLRGDGTWGTFPANGWSINGNAITGGEFIGTTNAQDFIIKTNNIERLRVSATGNIGIGDSSPAAMFTIGTNGLFRVESTGHVRAVSGSAVFPTYSFTGATSTGMFMPSINHLGFSTAGVERMRITETGNVGIGTTTPQQALDVAGNLQFSGAFMPAGQAGNSGQILISRGANNPPEWHSTKFESANSQQTTISSSTYTDITNLSITTTLATSAIVIISTHGVIKNTGGANGSSGAVIQVFHNNNAIPDLLQTVDAVNNNSYSGASAQWSMSNTISLPPGTHTISVKARKYIGDNFYAGGPGKGSLTLTIIPQ